MEIRLKLERKQGITRGHDRFNIVYSNMEEATHFIEQTISEGVVKYEYKGHVEVFELTDYHPYEIEHYDEERDISRGTIATFANGAENPLAAWNFFAQL